jgi:hypothetical protein
LSGIPLVIVTHPFRIGQSNILQSERFFSLLAGDEQFNEDMMSKVLNIYYEALRGESSITLHDITKTNPG